MEFNTGELLKAAKCVYLACDAVVADDISAKLNWAAAEIDRLNDLTKHLGACEDCHTEHECVVDGLRAALKEKDQRTLTLCFGTGQYMVADTFQEEDFCSGVCVYRNPNQSVALGQIDVGSHGKNTDEVGSILHLKFSNIESIDVWIRALNKAKETLMIDSSKGE